MAKYMLAKLLQRKINVYFLDAVEFEINPTVYKLIYNYYS